MAEVTEGRYEITKQQAQLFTNAVRNLNSAQGELNAIASAILAGHGVDAALNVKLDWSNPEKPALTYAQASV